MGSALSKKLEKSLKLVGFYFTTEHQKNKILACSLKALKNEPQEKVRFLFNYLPAFQENFNMCLTVNHVHTMLDDVLIPLTQRTRLSSSEHRLCQTADQQLSGTTMMSIISCEKCKGCPMRVNFEQLTVKQNREHFM